MYHLIFSKYYKLYGTAFKLLELMQNDMKWYKMIWNDAKLYKIMQNDMIYIIPKCLEFYNGSKWKIMPKMRIPKVLEFHKGIEMKKSD